MNQRKRVSFRILAFLLIMAMLSGTLTVVCAIEGIYHEPTGWDDLYGGSTADISRQALHCARMRFDHPLTGAPLDLRAPLPEDMRALCTARHLTVPEEYL